MRDDDIAVFLAHQRDRDARWMAAFTTEDADDVAGEAARWVRIRRDPDVLLRAVLANGQVTGHVVSFDVEGEREVSYWIGRPWWGRGIATAALRQLLTAEPVRPLHARVAKDNGGSLTVLQRCGFHPAGSSSSYAAGRGQEIDELLLVLDT